MSDMKDMPQGLPTQRAITREPSQALWRMSADKRISAMPRGELTWGQLCD